MKKWQNTAKILLLIIAVVSFSFFAFYKIESQGLLYHDAGVYLLETKFLDEGFHLLKSFRHREGGNHFWEDIKTKTEGVPLHSGKPGLNLIFWLASLFGGLNDSISAKVTAVAGILGLLLTFLISRKLSGWEPAIYSIAFLSSSVFYLAYARSGLAEEVVTVFFLSGILFYLGGRESISPFKLFLCGFCLGYASTCNPWRVLYMPALLIGLDFLGTLFEKQKFSNFIRRTLWITGGFIIPPILFELPYVILKIVFKTLPFPDYWSHLAQKLGWITVQSGGIYWFQHLGRLAKVYGMAEGPFWGTLVLLAWIFLLIRVVRKINFNDLFLWSFSFVTFFYFSSSSPAGQTIPRVVSNVIPFAVMGTGELLFAIEKKTNKPWISFALVLFLSVHSWPEQYKIANLRSGYREASQHLVSTGEKKLMIYGMEPVWRFHLGRRAYEPYERPKSMEEMIQKSEEEKIRYLIVDYSVLHSNHGADFTFQLMGKVTPVASFENPLGGAWIQIADQFGWEKHEAIVQDPWSRKIYIFDIQEIKRSL